MLHYDLSPLIVPPNLPIGKGPPSSVETARYFPMFKPPRNFSSRHQRPTNFNQLTNESQPKIKQPLLGARFSDYIIPLCYWDLVPSLCIIVHFITLTLATPLKNW